MRDQRMGIISAGFEWVRNSVFSPRIPVQLKHTTYESDGTAKTVRYSPYFLLDHLDEISNILCRVVVTFGNERLSESEKRDYKNTARNLFKNAHLVVAVTEIYFYNSSDKTKTITLESFISDKQACDESWLKSLSPIIVEAHSHVVIRLSIDHVFYLKDEFNIQFHAIIDERRFTVQGSATRLTSDDT